MQLEGFQPPKTVANDDPAPWCATGVAATTVEGGAEKDKRVTRRHRRYDRVLLGKGRNVLVELASRPQPRPAVLTRERGQRPHDVDEIFEAALWSLPHVLVAVGQLRQRTGVYLDCLRQVQRDPLAPWPQHLLDDLEDKGMHYQPLGRRRPCEQRAEALGPLSIKGASTHRRRGEAWAQVRLNPGDQGRLDRASEYARAVPRERRGVALDANLGIGEHLWSPESTTIFDRARHEFIPPIRWMGMDGHGRPRPNLPAKHQ